MSREPSRTKSISVSKFTRQPFATRNERISAKTAGHGYIPNYQADDTGIIYRYNRSHGEQITIPEASRIAHQERVAYENDDVPALFQLRPFVPNGFVPTRPGIRLTNRPQRGPFFNFNTGTSSDMFNAPPSFQEFTPPPPPTPFGNFVPLSSLAPNLEEEQPFVNIPEEFVAPPPLPPRPPPPLPPRPSSFLGPPLPPPSLPSSSFFPGPPLPPPKYPGPPLPRGKPKRRARPLTINVPNRYVPVKLR